MYVCIPKDKLRMFKDVIHDQIQVIESHGAFRPRLMLDMLHMCVCVHHGAVGPRLMLDIVCVCVYHEAVGLRFMPDIYIYIYI